MKKDKKIIWLFVLSIMGVMFSGYLSGVKFFTKTCAFKESCPYFLGYPACYFGFALFFALFILSMLLMYKKVENKTGLIYMTIVSFAGVMFAGYFTLGEIPLLIKEGLQAYVLGLPTCALGLVFFVMVFLISIMLVSTGNKELVKTNIV